MSAAVVGLDPLGVATVTSTVPIAPIGDVTVIEVLEFTVKVVAMLGPNNTDVKPVKYWPVIVTLVPPAAGPEVGEIDDTIGAGT